MATPLLSRPDSHVPTVITEHLRLEAERRDAVRRVKADYREMPGLSVTLKQGCRLWDLSPEVCASILNQLVTQGMLKRQGDQFSVR